MATIRSYIATYKAVPPRDCLLGAVKQGQSSRFQYEAEALSRLRATIELNGGPTQCQGRVVPSHLPPEIFRHCGHVSSTYGVLVQCRCPGCKKVLTKDDAAKVKAVPIGGNR